MPSAAGIMPGSDCHTPFPVVPLQCLHKRGHDLALLRDTRAGSQLVACGAHGCVARVSSAVCLQDGMLTCGLDGVVRFCALTAERLA